jgi:adenylate cyclase
MAAISSMSRKADSFLKRLFAEPPDLSRDEERLYRSGAVVITMAWLMYLLYVFVFAFWGVWPLVISGSFSVLILTVMIFLSRQQHMILTAWMGLLSAAVSNTFVMIFIGWGLGAQYSVFTVSALNVINPWYERRFVIGMNAFYVLLYIGWYYYSLIFPPLYTVPPLQLAVFNIINIVMTFIVIGVITMSLLAESDRANKANEDLLNNVLPRSIATRLKKKEPTIADGFQNASILFADLAGFTPVSQKMTPDELVEMLDAIFSRFDELVDQYGLEKIKTIGDEYMVASGIPIPREDHAQALADFALAMRDSLTEYSTAKNVDLQMRIGINSGPVVAGVIGKRRFLYDLWGDSVNTASRMESHGIPGEIQVTEATRDLLEVNSRFTFIDRGIIDIKGKGPMQTYLLQPNGESIQYAA